FRATRSPVSRIRAGPSTSASTERGSTAAPSRTRSVHVTSPSDANTRRATGSPATTPASLATTAPAAPSSRATVASAVTSPDPAKDRLARLEHGELPRPVDHLVDEVIATSLVHGSSSVAPLS